MDKLGFVLTLFVAVVSGCAILDDSEKTIERIEPGPQAVKVPSEPTPKPEEMKAPAPVKVPTVLPRAITQDDIRRLQSRLREVGFDPGPVDGIAGPKTKAALRRFESACSQVEGLVDPNVAPVELSSGQSPGRAETLALQRQLLAAGFNSGPADGVFGNRTKTVLTHVQNGCPSISEFADLLDHPATVVSSASQAGTEPQESSSPNPAQSLSTETEPHTVAIAMQPREEVRFLQVRLRDAGFDPGPTDGVMGPKTKLALEQYQARQVRSIGTISAKNTGQY